MHICTNCGGTKLERYDAFRGEIYSNVDAYVCVDCLHIEFYANAHSSEFISVKGKVDHREFVDQQVKTKADEADEVKKSLPALEARKTEIEDKMKSLSIAAQDENITIKQQKEYLAEIEALRPEYQKACSAYNDTVNKISKIEREIQQLYKSLK